MDIQHSINTLEHVTLMSRQLSNYQSTTTMEIPKVGAALSHTPVDQWTADQVIAWLATVDEGRFAHIILPPGMTGDRLLQLNSSSLAGLFAGDIRAARQEEEGVSWVIEGEGAERHVNIARALWTALRRERRSAHARQLEKIPDF